MKIKIFKSTAYLLVLSMGLMLSFTSCDKTPEPMELPPAESLVIDWDLFPSNTKKSEDLFTQVNFVYSALTVGIWNLAISLNMVIPTVAYAAAFNYQPVYLGDNSWEWNYSTPVNGKTINASLIGTRIDNETYSMEMTLSENGGFQDFKWFTGIIRYDGTEADWTLRMNPDSRIDFLNIKYEKDFETDVANIRYTVIDPQNNLYQGYVDFGIDPAMDLDAHYTIFKGNNTTSIEWSTTTDAGRVMDPAYFQNQEWHCWDSLLQDVDCPAEKQSLE